ncbi:sll1863 family stress response protein [Profundibacter sp.]
MKKQSETHEAISWAKQRLDDLDTMIAQVEKSADKLKDDARAKADAALARLQASRDKVNASYDQLLAETDAMKDDARKTLETEWIEVESAFQAFLTAAKDQAETVRTVIQARADAQRKYWEKSIADLRAQAESNVEKARGELDDALKRLSDETEKFQSRIGEVKDAGDESWKAVKAGLADAKAAHDRTIEKIRNAFSKET